MRCWILILTLAGGCGSGQLGMREGRGTGVAEHEREAVRNEREAAVHEAVYESQRRREALPPALSCADAPPWAADTTSGGEPLPVLRPCWTIEQRPSSDQLREAAEHRQEAARHRATAAALRAAERLACREIGRAETSHSPFYHRDDVLRVEPVERAGTLQGVRVVFRRVAGLDGAWMRKAVVCHQARAAALGYSSTIMMYCPLMIAPTTATIEETAHNVAVVIWADGGVLAAILARARALVSERSRR